jgi:hypothetical protein
MAKVNDIVTPISSLAALGGVLEGGRRPFRHQHVESFRYQGEDLWWTVHELSVDVYGQWRIGFDAHSAGCV